MTEPKLELVKLSPTADSSLRWADGSLKGLKTLKWISDGVSRYREPYEDRLIVSSPLHHCEWAEGKLTAEEFYDGEAVRGQGGIHAIWPPRVELDLDNPALEEFYSYAPQRGSRSSSSEFTCLVAGWGRCVMGDVGWRAEHARIRTIISPPLRNARLFRQWCRENNIGWSVL